MRYQTGIAEAIEYRFLHFLAQARNEKRGESVFPARMILLEVLRLLGA
jgi:hypothetical protein